jgi:hypothetical protein
VLEITSPKRGVVVVRFEGFATSDVAESILAAIEDQIAKAGTITAFDDWELATGYDPIVRAKLTDWMSANGSRIRATHVLVKSKVVSMGLSVANMILGSRYKIVAYSDRRRWQAALDELIAVRETTAG